MEGIQVDVLSLQKRFGELSTQLKSDYIDPLRFGDLVVQYNEVAELLIALKAVNGISIPEIDELVRGNEMAGKLYEEYRDYANDMGRTDSQEPLNLRMGWASRRRDN